VTPQEAANRAAAVLEKAESPTTTIERAQALTYVADSWTRLAEMLAEHPIAVAAAEKGSSA
jgi:hypothetical protein